MPVNGREPRAQGKGQFPAMTGALSQGRQALLSPPAFRRWTSERAPYQPKILTKNTARIFSLEHRRRGQMVGCTVSAISD